MNKPFLTEKQERFCREYVRSTNSRGDGGGNATEAYRRAYNVRPTTKNTSVQKSAKRIYGNPKVRQRIAELREAPAREAQLTLIDHLEELRLLREIAKEKGDIATAITAEVNRGKVSGLYVDRSKMDLNARLEIKIGYTDDDESCTD